ncbi:MAG: 2-oxo acid dehydrogenase subunit E2 [Planctomycetes bacterium]|nr:2-oxo acid dehydrogenase subunit E2 [Planctomycetota bacterium]
MDFKLPELGEGVYEAELVAWKVKPGDAVKPGQTLAEVLTDKATMEVPAPFAGTIDQLNAEPGEQLKVGDTVLSYQQTGAAGKHEKDGADKQPASKPTAEAKSAEDKPAEAPRRKAEPKQESKPRSADVAKTAPRREVNGAADRVPAKAAPSVRLMARKLGVELASIHGTGPQGRILIDDLSRALPAFSGEPKATSPRPDYGKPGTRVKLIGVRRKIAEHMHHAKQLIPHYSYIDECDVTDLVRIREGLKEAGKRSGVKITYLAFFVRAAVAALKEVPIVNASLDDEAGEIVLHDRYHIGFAAATPAGLIVPVIHDADKKSIVELARDIERLSADARAGKSKREDLTGGTFTITSIGNIGGLISTPIIHHPEVAILGIGKIVKRPVFDDAGQVRPADVVYLSFSFDHRVVDGAIGAAFGNALIRALKNPAGLLIDGIS